MARTRIKICGVREVATALAAAGAGADAIGLVFVARSPRCLAPAEARRIVDALPADVEPVGLFCDHSAEQVRETAAISGVRTVQLHGRERPQLTNELGRLKVLKAIAFEASCLAERLEPWRAARPTLTGILLDSPPKGDITGGGGVPFDWSALGGFRSQGLFDDLPPLWVAGGLTAHNVGDVVRSVGPFAVDVSSGVESTRGVKDHAMIAAFCAAVRDADRAA